MMRLYSLDYLSAPDASFTLILEELAKKNTICSIAFLKLHPQTNQVKIEQIQAHQKQLKKGCARFLMATVIDLAKKQ